MFYMDYGVNQIFLKNEWLHYIILGFSLFEKRMYLITMVHFFL